MKRLEPNYEYSDNILEELNVMHLNKTRTLDNFTEEYLHSNLLDTSNDSEAVFEEANKQFNALSEQLGNSIDDYIRLLPYEVCWDGDRYWRAK